MLGYNMLAADEMNSEQQNTILNTYLLLGLFNHELFGNPLMVIF